MSQKKVSKHHMVLSIGGFAKVQSNLSYHLGIPATAYLAVLISKLDYWTDRGRLCQGGFWVTKRDIKKHLPISDTTQGRLAKKLEKLGLIKTETAHIAPKVSRKFFWLEMDVIEKLARTPHPKMPVNEKQVVQLAGGDNSSLNREKDHNEVGEGSKLKEEGVQTDRHTKILKEEPYNKSIQKDKTKVLRLQDNRGTPQPAGAACGSPSDESRSAGTMSRAIDKRVLSTCEELGKGPAKDIDLPPLTETSSGNTNHPSEEQRTEEEIIKAFERAGLLTSRTAA